MSTEHRSQRTARQGGRGRGFNSPHSLAMDGKQAPHPLCFEHPRSERRQTIRGILCESRAELARLIRTPELDADLLLAHALERDRSYLHAYPEATLNEAQRRHFDNLVQRRAQGEPLAYILGFKEFWSLKLRVTQDVLIPRPETELLVELALARITERAEWKVADLGTGSGAIALAIAKERPRSRVTATDISETPLAVAADNAQQLGITNIRFLAGDWFAPLRGRFHLIVSNPPYVEAEDPHLRNPALRFEPRQALISAERGLEDLKCMARGAGVYLRPGGWLLVEHGFEQGEATRELFERSGFSGVKTYRDLADRERVTLGFHETDSATHDHTTCRTSATACATARRTRDINRPRHSCQIAC